MKFENLQQLTSAFVQGSFPFDDEVTVGDIIYHIRGSSTESFGHMVRNRSKAAVIYSCGDQHKEEAKLQGLDQWLVFVWEFDPTAKLSPAAIKPLSRARAGALMSPNIAEAADQNNVIGDTVNIHFTSIPDTNRLKGKVDTGAEISSLHAEKWEIKGNRVQFVSSKLSSNVITVPLYDHQAVKSVHGVQYRPVIEVNVRINDRTIQGVLFNLTDRSSMDFPVLIGQNVLEKGRFLIDPSIREDGQEDVDWNYVFEQVGTDPSFPVVNASRKGYDTEQVQKLYEALSEYHDVSLADLIEYIRTEMVRNINETEY